MPCYVRGCHEVARRRVNHPRFGRVGSCSAHDPDPNRLLVETSTDHGHAIAESCLREARQHFDKALVFWKSLHDKNSQSLRHACFRAYHSGLRAATTMLDIPFSGLDGHRCDTPLDLVIVARRLRVEQRLTIDIEPYLLELRDGTSDGEGRLLLNLDRFLDEVASVLRSPTEGGYRLIDIRLPELPSDPDTAVLVGPVGIDEAIAVWGGVEPGGECVLDWLKHEGDTVRVGEPLAKLRGNGCPETLPSPVDGVLVEIRAKRGKVQPGSVLAVVDSDRKH